MFDLFSLENDSELDQIDVLNSGIINDETAVDAAAEKKEPVEVSITESQAAHNEAASAGGCVVGGNEEQLTMDPVAAEESYIFGRFGLSAEELEEIVDETIKESDEIEAEDQAQSDADNDLEVTAVTEETTIETPETAEHETETDDELLGDLEPDEEAIEQLKQSEEGNLANGVRNVVGVVGSYGLQSVASSLWTSCVSCGTFKDGSEFLSSSKFKEKLKKFKEKYNNFPKLEDVKKDPRAKDKCGFWNWFFAGNAAGNKLKNTVKTDIKWKTVDGVPVAVTALDPITGSVDILQLAGRRVIVVTGFYLDSSGKLKCKNICRGYIGKGAKVNKSGESLDDIYAYVFGL